MSLIKVPFYKPPLPPTEEVMGDIRKAYESGMLAPSIYTDRFEREVESYLNVKHAVAFSNCSDAMMCLIGHLKTRSSAKYVIVPGFTFAATWQAVDWNGLTAIIVDTTLEGLINIGSVKQAIHLYGSSNILAIMAVHMFGNPAPVDDLEILSNAYNIPVIYDAAHGFGTIVNGAKLGNNGLAEVFSIGTTKPLAAGEGGVLTTNNSELAEKMRMAAMHGHKAGELDVEMKSLNGRIQEINSIIAYYGLIHLDETMKQRQAAINFYNSYFTPYGFSGVINNIPMTIRPAIIPRSGIFPSYKDYTIFITVPQSINLFDVRELFVTKLNEKGIPYKRYYYPSIDNLSVFKNSEATYKTTGSLSSLVKSHELAAGCVSIPFYTSITREEQQIVIDAINDIFSIDFHRID